MHRSAILPRATRLFASITLATTALFARAAEAQQYEVFQHFLPAPAWPFSELIQGSDGNFYGTTFFDKGTIFKMDASGNVTVLHHFAGAEGRNPYGALIQASDGNFYGTTYWGGTADMGTVFRMDPAGNVTTLHSFTGPDGAHVYARLLRTADGNFYGTTYDGGATNNGTIFKIDASGNLTTIHFFSGPDGRNPRAGLIQASDGNFYGTTAAGGVNTGTSNYGTVFKMDPSGVVTTLHSFGSFDGDSPYHELIEASDGNLYGTTNYGGPSLAGASGSVFKVDRAGKVTTGVHYFTGSQGKWPVGGLIEGTDGMLYGTTYTGGAGGSGTVFKMDFSGARTTLHSFSGTDGSSPRSPLLKASDGNFYGTASFGGRDKGTVFKLDPSGTVTAVHIFEGTDGKHPQAGLIQASDGSFYGTTYAGGLFGGTVLKMDALGVMTTIDRTGGSPSASLIQASDGHLYGTTLAGGATNEGAVFQIEAAAFSTTLYSFNGQPTDGASPQAALVQGSDGNFYGTTSRGGAADKGAVFKMDAARVVTTLHSFVGTALDGATPRSDLIRGSDGNFYGTTFSGGVADKGTIFKMDALGLVTIVKSFAGSDGGNPIAGLVQASDGNFYGTTYGGGTAEKGTLFKMDASGAVTTLHSFNGSDGASPYAKLIHASDGKLYGTTEGGGTAEKGTVFKLDPSGAVTTLHSFSGMPSDGANPRGALLQASDGKLYGTTFGGGMIDEGVVFRVNIAPPPVQLLSAASRKSHATAGTFEVDLPLTGSPGIECRSGGTSDRHQVVFTFSARVSVADGSVTPISGKTAETEGPPTISADGKEVTVNLKNVSNAQTVLVKLLGVSDGPNTNDVSVQMSVLMGDSNGDGTVNSGDAQETRNRSGQLTESANFRSDVNTDGTVNSGDAFIVRRNSGTTVNP